MSLSMYQASIPVFIRMLENLSAILTKGAAYAEARKIEPSVLLNDRLAPDMFPLTRQVQIATDIVKGGAARLSGTEIPSFPDTEKTFPELQARIAKIIDYLKSVDAKQIDGTEDKKISLKIGTYELNFTGQSYLLNFVIPNLFFHITTAYGILRHNGLDIGKQDFLGSM
ncbi:MAG: DUF1993 domain-containing protein [Rickettsiales bacterium]